MNLHEYITFPLLETALISLSPVRGNDLLTSHAGVTRGVVFLPFPSSSSVSPLAWNQAPLWGVKEKVISVGEKNRRVRFACRYFSYLAPFFCFCLLRIAPLRSLVPGYSSLSPFFCCCFFFFAFKMTAAIIYSGTPLYNEVPGYRKNCSLKRDSEDSVITNYLVNNVK